MAARNSEARSRYPVATSPPHAWPLKVPVSTSSHRLQQIEVLLSVAICFGPNRSTHMGSHGWWRKGTVMRLRVATEGLRFVVVSEPRAKKDQRGAQRVDGRTGALLWEVALVPIG